VLVKRETLTNFPSAFLLPVRWTKAVKAHSANLPPHIVSLAQRVRDFMGKEFEAWQLVALDSTYEDIDLSALELDGDSPTGALATTLAIAATGSGVKKRAVFTSVGWDGRLSPVRDIAEKVKLLSSFHGCDVVVHEADKDDACAAAGASITISAYEMVPRAAPFLSHFKKLLSLLERPPSKDAGDGLDVRLSYYNRDDVDADADARLEYYDKEIREDLAIELGSRSGIDPGSVFLLVFNPTNRPLSALMVDLVNPKALVVLRQRTSGAREADEQDQLRRFLAGYHGRFSYPESVVDLDPSDPSDGITKAIAKMREAPGLRGFVDMQNGNGLLRSAALCVGVHVGATPIGLEQRWSGRKLKVHADTAVQPMRFAIDLLRPAP
jgi:hypothetical protein